MSIETKNVTGRRRLRFDSYDDLMAEADRLASGPVETLGNWDLAQILDHLAKSLTIALDGGVKPFPLPMRLVLRTFMMKRFLRETIPSGFKFPERDRAVIGPDEQADPQEKLATLRRACERSKSEPQRAPHPGFGKITRHEWDQFNLRHAEMHLGFVIPTGRPSQASG